MGLPLGLLQQATRIKDMHVPGFLYILFDLKTQSRQTRDAVRLRDGWCRVTGTRATQRNRGTNYTGLEVAHIYPIGWVTHVSFLDFLLYICAQSNLSQVDRVFPRNSRVLALIRTKELADSMYNAILLRGDIHAMFDKYQFGINVNPFLSSTQND